MSELAILGRDGTHMCALHTVGLIGGLKLDGTPSWQPGVSSLSWKEEFPAGSHRIQRPEAIVMDSGSIYLRLGVLHGEPDGLYVRIETRDPAEMPKLIEMTVAYIGGKVSTFDINPTQPNSFVGGVANDFRRLVESVRRAGRALKQKIGTLGMAFAR